MVSLFIQTVMVFFFGLMVQLWKITDKIGSGKAIASGQESINDKWSDGGKARHYPT